MHVVLQAPVHVETQTVLQSVLHAVEHAPEQFILQKLEHPTHELWHPDPHDTVHVPSQPLPHVD